MTTVVSRADPHDSLLEVPEWFRELRVIDVDAHYSEPGDLWTRHAPKGFEKRLPHIAVVDGRERWVFDGIPIAEARATSIILPDRSRANGMRIFDLTLDQVHPGSYDWRGRLELMDRMGIWAQVLYSNVSGHGNQRLMSVDDAELRALSARVFNDAMAEIQEASGERLIPVAHLPWWDIKASIAELRRVAKMGMRGFAMCSDPQDAGLPDLRERAWDPFWETCCELNFPVSFHVGASDSSEVKNWFGPAPWPSQPDDVKLMIGSLIAYFSNAKIITNLILGGVLERFPELKVVSVESGVGWMSFLVEAMDYLIVTGADRPFLPLKPSEYFRRQVYATFWFEKITSSKLDDIGMNALFQTDIPHAHCLYPDTRDHIVKVFENIDPIVRRRLLQDNAAQLYRLDLKKI